MSFYRPPLHQGALHALGSVCRAIRAWKFYPNGHPTRKNSVRQALATMQQLLDGHNLLLVCGRSGFSYPDGDQLKDATGLTAFLSFELFIRRAQKITFLADLTQEDLLDLIRILCLPPEAISKAGGMDRLMAEHGIRTIWVNEFDLSAIQRKRRAVEARGVTPPGLDELENCPGEEPGSSPETARESSSVAPAEELEQLLVRLAESRDQDSYLRLVRQALACADALLAESSYLPLLPLVELLAAHANDRQRPANVAASARLGLEQLATAGDLLAFLVNRIGGPEGASQEALLAILGCGGPAAIAMIVERMDAADSLPVRRELCRLLAEMGEQALPAILELMNDRRWYILRNLAAVLGVIASPLALAELQQCRRHSDVRVAKEAIRSMARIGGLDAEKAIIEVLSEKRTELLSQALFSLGAMKSRAALPELSAILVRDNLLLRTLPLKLDVLSALAMIADRSVLPLLTELLLSRHLVARSRWERFKTAIAVCLGKLGDPRALPALRELSDSAGEAGQACRDAVTAIERNRSNSSDNP